MYVLFFPPLLFFLQTHTHTRAQTLIKPVSRCRVYKDRRAQTGFSFFIYTHLIHRYYCHKTNIYIHVCIFTIFSAFLFSTIFHSIVLPLAASNYLFICFHADIRVTKHEQRPLLNVLPDRLNFGRGNTKKRERERACMRQACQVVCSALLINSAGPMLTVSEKNLIFSLNLLHSRR